MERLEKAAIKWGREYWGMPLEERDEMIARGERLPEEYYVKMKDKYYVLRDSGFMGYPFGKNVVVEKTIVDLMKECVENSWEDFLNEAIELGKDNVTICGWDFDFNLGYNPELGECFEYEVLGMTPKKVYDFYEKYPKCLLLNYYAEGTITIIRKW